MQKFAILIETDRGCTDQRAARANRSQMQPVVVASHCISLPGGTIPINCVQRMCPLTCFFVEKNLVLFDGMVLECLFDTGNGLLVGHLAVHEAASCTLLHDFGSIVTGDSAEGLRAIYDRVIDDLSICKQKTAVSCGEKKKQRSVDEQIEMDRVTLCRINKRQVGTMVS